MIGESVRLLFASPSFRIAVGNKSVFSARTETMNACPEGHLSDGPFEMTVIYPQQ